MKPSILPTTVEGFRQRLANLERSVTDLQRRGGGAGGSEQIGRAEVATGAAPAVEGFRAAMVGGTASTGGAFNQATWDLTTDATSYISSGVTFSNFDQSVDLSPGFWVLTLQFDVFTNFTATSGAFNVGLGNDAAPYDGAGEYKAYTHWPASSSRANFHLTLHTFLSAATTYSVFFFNNLDVAGTITGQFSGTRIGDGSVVFGGP